MLPGAAPPLEWHGNPVLTKYYNLDSLSRGGTSVRITDTWSFIIHPFIAVNKRNNKHVGHKPLLSP